MTTESTTTTENPTSSGTGTGNQNKGKKSSNGYNNQRNRNNNNRNNNRNKEPPEFLKPILTERTKLEKQIQNKKDIMAKRKAERQSCTEELDELNKAQTSSDEFKAVLEEKKQISRQLQTHKQERNVLTSQIKEVQARVNQAQNSEKDVSVGKNKFRNLKEVEDRLKFLENQRYSTRQLTAREDNQILNEMDALEKAKDGFAIFQAQREALQQDKLLQKEIQTKLDQLRNQMNPLTTKEKQLNERLDKVSNRNSQTKNQLIKKRDELGKENNAAYEEIAALYTKLNELSVEEKEKRTKWEAEQEAAREQKKKEEEQRKKDLIKKYEEEFLRKHPYEFEMKVCDELSTYLETLISNLNRSNDSNASNSTSPSVTETSVPKKQHENTGGFFDFVEDDEVVRSNKKKKNRKGNKGKVTTTYQVNIDMISNFTKVKCEPPTKPEEFEGALEKIKTKKQWYIAQPLPTKVEITLDENDKPIVNYPDITLEKTESSTTGNGGGEAPTGKSGPSAGSNSSNNGRKDKKSSKLNVQSSEEFPSLSGN